MRGDWNRIWSPQRWQRAQDLRAKGFSDSSIANDIGLTKTQVSHKLGNEAHARRAFRAKQQLRESLNERDALFAIPRTLTASVFGDPLPGRSALDKRRLNQQ